jgi:hypothetical protein
MSSVDALAAVIEALEACQIEYMIVGALSVNAYAVSRSTKDADIVLSLQPHQLTELTQRLGSEFQFDPQQMFETLTGSIRNVLTYRPTGFQIELFRLNSRNEHHVERFRRRCRQFLREIDREVWLPTVEDVVIQKLRWQRRHDLDDVVNVLRVSGDKIDWKYLRSWTAKHGTDALLDSLLQESSEPNEIDETP